MKPRLIVAIVGATATGKTAVGERVATAIGGEVVCADSRQVYRELDIGTGKPDALQREQTPHHLFDALSLGEPASAGWFARAVREACAAIHARDHIPVLVGGSGLYLNAARHGLADIPDVAPGIRARLRREIEACGAEALHARLADVDPESAARLAPRDRQRVSRALEVEAATGRALSWWLRRPRLGGTAGRWLTFQLVVEPAQLRERIARRTAWMFDHGLLEETRGILASDRGTALRELRAIGYDEAVGVIDGRIERAAAEARTDQRTVQLAKRQRTWFRHQISAVDVDGAPENAAYIIEQIRVQISTSR